MVRHAPPATLLERLAPPRAGTPPLVRTALRATVGIAFLAALAQLRLPVGPVPITGQTLGVLLLGAAYGAGLGALATGGYLLLGGLGLPIFTGGHGGWTYLAGPTAGYLVGFVLAAAVLGALTRRGWDRRYGRTALAMLVANVLIYLPGLLWLHQVLGGSWGATLAAGLLPFLPGDALKWALAVALLPTAWKVLGER
jgi:biotin transport system substrate-specific component